MTGSEQVRGLQPLPPLFVWEPNDLTAFASAQELESYLEAVDVEAGRYIAYDAAGHLLKLEVEPTERPLAFGIKTRVRRVVIGCVEEAPDHRLHLRQILEGYARQQMNDLADAEVAALALGDLAEHVAKHCCVR